MHWSILQDWSLLHPLLHVGGRILLTKSHTLITLDLVVILKIVKHPSASILTPVPGSLNLLSPLILVDIWAQKFELSGGWRPIVHVAPLRIQSFLIEILHDSLHLSIRFVYLAELLWLLTISVLKYI